ncbi:MAG TPA: hypothetical protein DEO88_12220 [Syntrophobacteraceae bacterium]|nr:hypothetical protein [Syntrophobacteraceae bacterium]
MGAACKVLPFRDTVAEFRAMAHKALDDLIDNLEASFQEQPAPTLMELSERLQENRAGFLAATMKATIERLFPDYVDQVSMECPVCSKMLQRKRFESKQISTLQGKFVLRRPYFYCNRCKCGFSPLDEILQLAEELHQHDIQERITDLVARMPYEEAAQVFQELTGIAVGNHFAHDTLNAVAQSATPERVIPNAEEISRRIEEATTPGAELPILAVG